MENKKIKQMLDACYRAKRIRDMLPELPKGVTSSYIQYLDVIQTLEKEGKQVKVSDISERMNLPRPGVTRTVKEMENKGYLKKISSSLDRRIVYISLTDAGKELSNTYDKYYFSMLERHVNGISDKEADNMILTIDKFYQIMKNMRKENE